MSCIDDKNGKDKNSMHKPRPNLRSQYGHSNQMVKTYPKFRNVYLRVCFVEQQNVLLRLTLILNFLGYESQLKTKVCKCGDGKPFNRVETRYQAHDSS